MNLFFENAYATNIDAYQTSIGFSEESGKIIDLKVNGIGDVINLIMTILIVVLIVAIIFKLSAGALLKSTSDIVFDQTKGTKMIKNSLKILLYFILTYSVLSFINPDLTYWNIIIDKMKKVNTDNSRTGGNTSNIGNNISDDANRKRGKGLSDSTIITPTNGGTAQVRDIVMATVGKVTYRYGAKGNGEGDISNYNCPVNNKDLCGECYENTVCGDCSWFVNFVRKRAGLPVPGGGSNSMRSAGVRGKITGPDTFNNIRMTPGDILVYGGHVVIYIGNGEVAQSKGGEGRNLNKAISIVPTTDLINEVDTILKVN